MTAPAANGILLYAGIMSYLGVGLLTAVLSFDQIHRTTRNQPFVIGTIGSTAMAFAVAWLWPIFVLPTVGFEIMRIVEGTSNGCDGE
jgi:hypothetical protein